jgi:hypothetical protein
MIVGYPFRKPAVARASCLCARRLSVRALECGSAATAFADETTDEHAGRFDALRGSRLQKRRQLPLPHSKAGCAREM